MKTVYIILAFASFIFSSCGDFLNESPRHKWDVGKAMTTYASAQQAVTGIYGVFMPGDILNIGLNVTYTDRSGLTKRFEDYYNFTYTQSNSPSSFWRTAYNTINAANLAINNIPGIPESAFPTSTAREELIGEARFLRGYAYSILLLNYALWWDEDSSPYGLVYRDQVTDVGNVHQPRITVGESWKKVFDDLDFAIAHMSDTFGTAKTASRFLAKAYKAKLLLIRGAERNAAADIRTAKELVDECLGSLPSAIGMQGDMAEHFAQSWDSKENIFVRYLEDNASRTDNAGKTCCYDMAYIFGTECILSGADVPQSEALCGLVYGLDWMRDDPRWYIATGRARNPETWDDAYSWTWTKIYRKGRHAGKLDPIDEKYAVYLMRLPELYIMQAELRARTGAPLADAIAPINTFRALRTNPRLDPVPVPSDEEALWDAIFREYCKELIFENGCEYFASLRIMKAGHTYMEEMKGANFVYDRTKRQFPVPHAEMINNAKLAGMQNPGQE